MATETVQQRATVQIDMESIEFVRESNYEISRLAEGMVRLLGINRDDDFAMYHGILARIQQLSEMQFLALNLHGEPEEKMDSDRFRDIKRLFKGMLP